MIPTMLLFGLVLGRWWKAAILAGAVVWPLLLLATGVEVTVLGLFAAAVLGGINTAVGAALHQALLGLVRRLRRDKRVSETATHARR